MSGKRGRSTPESKESSYASEKSFTKYLNKYGSKIKEKPSEKDEISSDVNKAWVKNALKENKEYEHSNGLHTRGGEWDSVFKKAEKSGISTKKLEGKASKSSNPHELKEYGLKPHVKSVMKAQNELQKSGLMPGAKIKGFDVVMKGSSVHGAYRPSTGEYVINANSLSLGRIESRLRKGTLAGKSFNDIIVHELGHAVFFNNYNRIATGKNLKRTKQALSKNEREMRNAFAQLQNTLRKNLRDNRMGGLSSYVDGQVKGSKAKSRKGPNGTKIPMTKADRKRYRKSAYAEGFAEAYVNLYRHKKYGTALHPMGKAVGDFIKAMNKYK